MAYIDEQTKRIEDMYANLKKQKLGELESQNTQVVTDLRRQLAEQLPQYQTARAQADVGQVQNMNKLKEYMASTGAFNSGDNFSRASNILAQRSNAVNQINGNENAYTLGVNNKIADANNLYNSNLNSLNTQLDTQKAQALMELQAQLHQEQLQAAARRSSGGGSSNGLSNNMSAGSTYNKEVADLNDIVQGSYNLSEKQRVLQRYITDKKSQNGKEAAALAKYAQQALDEVNKQMSDYVNIGRYEGYENRRY